MSQVHVVTNGSNSSVFSLATSTSNSNDGNGQEVSPDGQYNTHDSEDVESTEDGEDDTASVGHHTRSTSDFPDAPTAAEALAHQLQVFQNSLQDYHEYGYFSDSDSDSESDTETPGFTTCAICSRRKAKMCLIPCDHNLCSPCLIGMWWAKIAMPHQWPEEIRCPFCRSDCGNLMDGEGVPVSVLWWVLMLSENAVSRLLAEDVGVAEPVAVRPILTQMRALVAQIHG